uniref:FeFe-hydrogenase n=1 Tax=Tetraselmis sp. GSL018 TaxID=582737 RepID=W5VTI9_9CHLO|nr:FeFe-hydrogenase [Tetraselmis sp. GSL018]
MATSCKMSVCVSRPVVPRGMSARLPRRAFNLTVQPLRSNSVARTSRSGVFIRAAAAAPAPTEGKPAPKKKVDNAAVVEKELGAKGDKVFIAATAPAVRLGISEEFGLPPGTNSEKQMVSALRKAGFDYVFDVNFSADLTILEEGTELLNRLVANVKGEPDAPPLPMFTSCCPGWIDEIEKRHGELIPNISTCKSPQGMLGAVVKHYFAEKIGRKPEDVELVSIMPCVRKLGESERPQNQSVESGKDVDFVLTTVECANLLRSKGIELTEMEEDEYDEMLGTSSGAAQLFGTTGGVMEAALRTVYEVVTGKQMERLEINEVRGLEGVKEAVVEMKPIPGGILANGDKDDQEPIQVRVAVANGLGNAKALVQQVKDGESPYHFIEVMACPGGCINGAGQPRSKDKTIGAQRQSGMYDIDERRVIRQSHKNPRVQQLYDEFLETPNGHLAHKLLHTYYQPKTK